MRALLQIASASAAIAAGGALRAGEPGDAAVELAGLVRQASLGRAIPATSHEPAVQQWRERYGATLAGGRAPEVPAAPDWGYVTEHRDESGGYRQIYLHVFHPPASGAVHLRVAAGRVVACRALTEACANLSWNPDSEGIAISLPATRDPLDTVIELDVKP